MVTLAEIIKLALPPDTQVLMGADHLHRPITWAQAMRAQPPAFSHLEGGELVLVDLELLDHSYDAPGLNRVITNLDKVGVGAVAVRGQVAGQAVEHARTVGLPLLSWNADGPSARDVEREVMRCILDREMQLERYSSRIAESLAQVTIRGEGLQALAQCLTQISGRTVCVQDEQGAILTHTSPVGEPLSSELQRLLETDTRNLAMQPEERDYAMASKAQLRPLDDTGFSRWIIAILTGRSATGFLSLLGPTTTLDEADRVAVERGATACGLELARQQTAHVDARETQSRLLDAIRAGYDDLNGLNVQARKLGYDLRGRQTAFCVAPQQQVTVTIMERCAQVIEAELRTRRMAALVAPQETCVSVCLNLPPGKPARRGRRLANAVLQALQEQMRDVPIIIGVGRSSDGLEGLRDALAEAEQARHLGQALTNGPSLLYYGDLGVYRLLLPLQGTEVLHRFYEEALAPLVAYDEKHGTELVNTLAAYFQQRGNVTRSAETLFLHRNTLLYRLERIKTILEIDLEDQELLLQLQVALKVHQILP